MTRRDNNCGPQQGEHLRQHVFLTAALPGLTTGLIITTTKRTYYLTCKSVQKSPVRVVRWQYPREEVKPLKATEPGLLPDPQEPRHSHVGYELTSPGHRAGAPPH